MTLMICQDALVPVHEGDLVRYTRYDWLTRGKFYRKVGIVTEVRETSPGDGVLGVHFPHYLRGANMYAVIDHFRLVRERTVRNHGNSGMA